MKKFLRTARGSSHLGAISIAALLAAAPQLVYAQDTAAAPTGETVIITGLRGSLTKAISIKKSNASVVEVITAEEIGKLPDASIGESLARLPGIAGQRVGGDVEQFNIRGTSPDFTVTTLNGRLQGSLSDGRGVEVNQYPSELMGSVVVYKTPDAAITGQGLSGTVDLRAIRPLSMAGRQLMVNLRADTTSLDQLHPDVDKGGFRGSLSYVNQFMDGKLGVALGYAHLDSTRQTQYQEIWGYDGNTSAAATPANAGVVSGHTTRAFANKGVRDGFMGIVEYKPNDNSHTTLDLYYSKYDQEEIVRGVEGFLSASWLGPVPTRGNIVDYAGTKITDTATYAKVVPILTAQYHGREDTLFAGGVNHQFKAGILEVTADLSYSKAEGDRMNVEMFANYGPARQFDPSIALNWESEGFTKLTPTLNYGDASKIYLGDNAPGGWGEGNTQSPHIEDSYAQADFKGKIDLSETFAKDLFDSFEMGVNFTNHEKMKSSTDANLCFKSFQNVAGTATDNTTQGGNDVCGTPAVSGTYRRSLNPINSIGSTDLSWAGWGNLAAFDLLGTLNSQYNIVGRNDNNRWQREWGLTEQIFTAFTRLNIDKEVMGRRLRGNIGVQFVDSSTESTGWALTGGGSATNPFVPVQVKENNHYTDVLPSLNLSYDIMKNVKVRLGAAKQMARPRPDEMRASVAADLNLITAPLYLDPPTNSIPNPDVGKYRWSGNGGNPQLKPWRADAFDATIEWYPNAGSMIAIQGFYKIVDSYIYNQTSLVDFSDVPNPLNRPIVSAYGNFTAPKNGAAGANGKDAYIKGLEFNASIDFGKTFPNVPYIDGFGVVYNYSKNMTNISPSGLNPDGSRKQDKLPGFSPETENVTVFYEKYGFNARISRRWRAAVRADTEGFFSGRTFSQVAEDEQVDAQIGYKFGEGKLEGLSLLLQAQNLTDSLFIKTSGTLLPNGELLPSRTEQYGTRYLFGVSYKF